MQVSQSKSVTLPANPDEVWDFVSDFAGFPAWQPHIDSVEMLPDGQRRVFFERGDTILDRVTERDDAARTFTYAILPGQDVPLSDMAATLAVRAVGDGSEVEYTIEVDVPDEMEGPARAGIGSDIDGALAGLADKFDG